jgi:hypothetical protein
MSTLPAPSPELIRSLLERVTRLEARLERLESRGPERGTSSTTRVTDPDERLVKLRASLEHDRLERLKELRQNPGLLAAIRERRAVMNQFYVSRGLTPDPDPYPELP